MKNIITGIISVLFVTISYSQTIPDFIATPRGIGMIDSTIILKISHNHDFILAFRHNCPHNRSYPNKSIYNALTYKNDKWKFIQLIVTFKLKRKTTHFEEKWLVKLQSRNFNKNTADSLLLVLHNNKLFSLSNDSINVYSKSTSDTTGYGMSMSHGCYDHFIFAIGNKMRKIYAYEPKFYQDSIPVTQRAMFINCQNSFESMTKKYWYRR